jgi:hypothetical protein
MYPPTVSFAVKGGATAIPLAFVLTVTTRAVRFFVVLSLLRPRLRAIVKWPLAPRAGALKLTIAPATGLP